MTDLFRIGEFGFDSGARTLISAAGETILEPRVAEVLQMLARTLGPVSRRDLLSHVWGAQGSDEALTQAVSRLRHALGDNHRPHRYIRTISRVGYQLGEPAVLVDELNIVPSQSSLTVVPETPVTGKKRLEKLVILTRLAIIIIAGFLVWFAFNPLVVEHDIEIGDDREVSEIGE